MTKLKCNDEIRFTKILDIWHVKFKDFLNEIKGYQEREGKILFNHKNHKKLLFPNTTNLIKGKIFFY